jgi:hypothetical protein
MVLRARYLRTLSLDAAGRPTEVIAAFSQGESVPVGEMIDVRDGGRFVVLATWPAGQSPEIYNELAFDAEDGDTVARLRPIHSTTA